MAGSGRNEMLGAGSAATRGAGRDDGRGGPSPGVFRSGPVRLDHAGLFTDLYELTMAASYVREGMGGDATFSLFVRHLPAGRPFLVFAGLEDTLRYLEALGFDDEALRYLERLDLFDPGFLEFLRTVRFTGDVWAMPEGTVAFANEPLLEVTAPLVEAQLVETAVLNLCHGPTVVASKAVRAVMAAGGRPVIDFGLRRSPGVHQGMGATRAALIAGYEGTSNVLAGMAYGATPAGTMAHSFVSAFPSEVEAFRAFARAFPDGTVLLIDTYDTAAGAVKAAEVAKELEAGGHRLVGVRLDSGDLVGLSREVRGMLDRAGLHDVRIMASGGLDEVEIARCLAAGAPLDAFGVGTRVSVAADAPYLDMAYKLVRYAGRDVLKLSEGKETLPGEKQVFRVTTAPPARRRFVEDRIALRSEGPPPGPVETLLRPVMRRGRIVGALPSVDAIRARCRAQVAALPAAVRRLEAAREYPVRCSEALRAHGERLRAQAVAAELSGSPVAPAPAG